MKKINMFPLAHRPAVASREGGFTLIELLVVMAIIAILAGAALPVFTAVQERGKQTKDLSNGRQVGLALKQFAIDYNGEFPNRSYGTSTDYYQATVFTGAETSNDAFRWLLPTYTTSEDIFVVPGSKWSPSDDNILDTTFGTVAAPGTLVAGENGYAYTAALSDTSNPQMPLLCDGWAVGTPADFVTDKTIKGGVWGGQKAIVILVDGSGRVMTVDDKVAYTVNRPGSNPAYSMWDLTHAGSPDNWLAAANFLLFPANDGNP